MSMKYPTELAARAQYEIDTFERVSMQTGIELLAEVVAWRTKFKNHFYEPLVDEVIEAQSEGE